jgi:hypothetical protein
MTDTTPTVPPPSPGDQLVGRVVNALTVLSVLLVLAVVAIYLLTDRPVPDVLGTMLTVSITALATLLSGRTRP